MPIYEYACGACGTQLEVLQKLSDPALTICPKCGGEQFRKKISAAGFRLKGGGWYATDFKNSGKPAAKTDAASGGTDTGSDKGAEKGADKGAEAKPAATSTPGAGTDTKQAAATD